MAQTGRPSIFGPKDTANRVNVIAMTTRGKDLLERARARLRKLAKWGGKVSDGDTIEYLLRGDAETAQHLAAKQKAQK